MVRGIAWSVNSVAPGRKGSGTRGDYRSIKYVVVVVERESPKTTANAVLSSTFSVDPAEKEKEEEIKR